MAQDSRPRMYPSLYNTYLTLNTVRMFHVKKSNTLVI